MTLSYLRPTLLKSVALTDGTATVATDASLGGRFTVALDDAAVSLAIPTNAVDGDVRVWEFDNEVAGVCDITPVATAGGFLLMESAAATPVAQLDGGVMTIPQGEVGVLMAYYSAVAGFWIPLLAIASV